MGMKMYLSVRLSIYLSIYLFIYLSIYLSIYLFIYLFVRPSVCLFILQSLLKSYLQDKSFQRVGQTPRSRLKGQKRWYPQKGLVTRNTHVKYQSSRTYGLKLIIVRLNFSKNRSNSNFEGKDN